MEAIKTIVPSKLYDRLSPAQREAITTIDGPTLVLAVPGAGKTTTLLLRTAYLQYVKKVQPNRILSLTFSKASARDMEERFETLFRGQALKKVHFSTIHAFCYGVVISYGRARHIDYILIESNRQAGVNKAILLRQIYQQVCNEYLSEGDYENLVSDLGYVKNKGMSTAQIRGYNSDIQDFFTIYKRYEAIKQEHNWLDFDDMLTMAYEILKKNPEILEIYQSKYDYIQIDEGQDTSQIQHDIIELLAKDHQQVFYVADDDQSIYGFRGASPDYLLEIKAAYPKAKIIKMENNYRSTGHIVGLSNQFIKANKLRYEKEIVTDNQTGQQIQIIKVKDRHEQYVKVQELINLKSQDGTVAVLYRNNHSAVSLVHQLSKKMLDFSIKGFQKAFFDHFVFKDMMAILRFSRDPYDEQSFRDFYYKLKGYYIKKSMIESVFLRESLTVVQNLMALPGLEKYQMDRLDQLDEDMNKLAVMKPVQGIEFILTHMGYLSYLQDRTSGHEHLFEHYQMLINVLKDVSEEAEDLGELTEAIQGLEAIIAEKTGQTQSARRTLSTMHSSKGLEWDHVILMDMQAGMFPSTQSERDDVLMEEERRTCYVAMTRAKTTLTIMEVDNGRPSTFLEEIQILMGLKKPRRNSLLDRYKTWQDKQK